MARTLIKPGSVQMDLHTIDNIKHFIPVYHGHEDVLFLRPDKPRPATSIDCNGEFWIRVDPISGEIFGLEIGDFEAIFLKKHPELATAWAEVKPWCHSKNPKTHVDSFLLIIVDFIHTFLLRNPQQLSYDVVPAS